MNHPMKSRHARASIPADKWKVDVVTVKMNNIESGSIVKYEIHHPNVVW